MFDEVTGVELDGAAELSLFDQLLKQAEIGEKLVNARVGKHEGTVTSVGLVSGEHGYRVEVRWSGMTDQRGMPFEYTDSIFFPDKETLDFLKARFMQKLKALGAVPQKFEEVLYCNSEEAAPTLHGLIERASVGNSYPVEIKQDKNGYVSLTVRNRPKGK